MKAAKPPKMIDSYLKSKGFGLDKKTNYYLAKVSNSPLVLSIHFGINELNKYLFNICLGVNYPIEANSIVMNPPELDSLKPDGQLKMVEDSYHDQTELWNFSQSDSALTQFSEHLETSFRLLLDQEMMLKILSYLTGESDDLPDQFSYINTPYLQKKPTPNRLLMTLMYQIVSSDFDGALLTLSQLPAWTNSDIKNKLIEDVKSGETVIPPENTFFLESIGASFFKEN